MTNEQIQYSVNLISDYFDKPHHRSVYQLLFIEKRNAVRTANLLRQLKFKCVIKDDADYSYLSVSKTEIAK